MNWTSGAVSITYAPVYALAVSGSNIYAGGSFTSAGGHYANYVAKWDGSNWSPLGSGLDGIASSLAISGGDLHAGGGFTVEEGKVSPHLAKAVIVSGAHPVSSFLDSGDFVIQFEGTPGITYTTESTSGIVPANWQKVANIMAPSTNQVLGADVFEFRDAILPSGQRFYRAVYPAY